MRLPGSRGIELPPPEQLVRLEKPRVELVLQIGSHHRRWNPRLQRLQRVQRAKEDFKPLAPQRPPHRLAATARRPNPRGRDDPP
jgi:SRSO17 transposase